jgi:uncharacterized membrane protein
MEMLIAGLVLFLGVHALRVWGEGLRSALVLRLGPMGFKLAYSLVSLGGFYLLIVGYGQARLEPIPLWTPPRGMAHATLALMWLSMVLLAAAEIPRNAIKARLRHPMVLGVKVWALAHILANGTLHDVLLFGGFLVWAVLSFRAARQRDRAAREAGELAENLPVSTAATVGTVLIGTAAWAAFILVVHAWLIGVAPIAGMAL